MYAILRQVVIVMKVKRGENLTGKDFYQRKFSDLRYMYTVLYQRMTNACLGPQYLSRQIPHATLNHTRNVSDSRAVVQYAERSYTTCSFQDVCTVSTHK